MFCLGLGDQVVSTVKEVIIKVAKVVVCPLSKSWRLLVRFFRGHGQSRVVSFHQNACIKPQQGFVIEIVIPVIRRGLIPFDNAFPSY